MILSLIRVVGPLKKNVYYFVFCFFPFLNSFKIVCYHKHNSSTPAVPNSQRNKNYNYYNIDKSK